jgi:hypothetical protein
VRAEQGAANFFSDRRYFLSSTEAAPGSALGRMPASRADARRRPDEPRLDGRTLVLSVYETHSGHSSGYHPTGEATVSDTRPNPHVLVLSSYEPVHWTINLGASSGLTEIVLNGYHDQTVSAPAGVAVSNDSGFDDDGPTFFVAYGYAWPNNNGGCDTPALVSGVESFSGLPPVGLPRVLPSKELRSSRRRPLIGEASRAGAPRSPQSADLTLSRIC